MDCIVICCSQPGLFINITCNNENIHIDSAIHLILNQIRISRGRVKRLLLKKKQKNKNLPSENFNCLQKSSKTEKTRILPYYIRRKLWLVYNSPPNDLIWTFSWPFRPVVNLDCSQSFRPSLCALCAPLCVEYGRVTLPCRRLCQGLTVSVQSSWSCLVFLGLKIWNAVGAKIIDFS